MIDDAATGKDSTADVHLPPHPRGKAKYPSQIKMSSNIELHVQNLYQATPFQAVKPL